MQYLGYTYTKDFFCCLSKLEILIGYPVFSAQIRVASAV